MPRTHQFGVMASILPLIINGRKSLEIRVADEKRKGVRTGDLITFNHKTTRRVVRVCGYLSFSEMLEKEQHEKIMPGWSKDHILAGLREIYPEIKENLGVLVFELQVDP